MAAVTIHSDFGAQENKPVYPVIRVLTSGILLGGGVGAALPGDKQ